MRAGRFLAACRREPVDGPPVWVMRQAGRYLPEYRRTRAEAGSFLGLCRNPELACEVTLQPIRRFGFDAAIIFSDILLPLTALGVDFAFPDEGGPRIQRPLSSPPEWQRLALQPATRDNELVAEAIALVRGALPEDVALLGFCGAPWTLASYLVEGGTSRDHAKVKAALLTHPEAFRTLLDLLADAMGRYLVAQVRAGADAVQVFDSWAGSLPADLYERFVVPSLVRVFEHVGATGVPRILYVGGACHLLPVLRAVPCEVVSVDWRTELARAAAALPDRALQGNLDPAVLLSTPEVVRDTAAAMLQRAPETGYIANLGHGILPPTPPDNLAAFVAAVRESR